MNRVHYDSILDLARRHAITKQEIAKKASEEARQALENVIELEKQLKEHSLPIMLKKKKKSRKKTKNPNK